MKIDKRDLLFVGLIVVVLGTFLAISGKEKTTTVPDNEMHKIVYQTAYSKAPAADASLMKRAFFKPDKKAAEVYCQPCHNEKGVIYPPDHPPKNRCLFCHKLKKK